MVYAHHGQKLLKIPQAAERLGVSRSRVYELMAQGALVSVKIGGSRRIPDRVVDEYIDSLVAAATA
jgi:excisionase family DNA binding protein